MGQAPFIEIKEVTKIYGDNVILDEISLNVEYGKILGIIGKSGEGKTTLLDIMMGFLKPEKGKVYFQSRDILKDMKDVEEQFGFAAQEGSFYDKLTVRENMNYFGELYGMDKSDREKRIKELLKLVELTGQEDKKAGSLSTGMKKRLDIAC